MQFLSKIRQAAVVVAIAVTTAIGVAGPANAEQFHSSILLQNWRPWASPSSQGWQPISLRSGQSVDMRCWTTGANVAGTAKWFKVRSNSYPFPEGYVPATLI